MTRHDRLRTACITVLGSGYGPLIPGTWGSLVAVLLFGLAWRLADLLHAPRLLPDAVAALGVIVSSWLCVRWGGWAVAYFGRADPRPFVLDELAGQWVALLLLPIGSDALGGWLFVVAGQFILFRLFDIFKPPPARQVERLPAGWGILADDLVAGLYANVVGQVLWRLTPLTAWLGSAAKP